MLVLKAKESKNKSIDYENENGIVEKKKLSRTIDGQEPQQILSNDISHDSDLRILSVKFQAL